MPFGQAESSSACRSSIAGRRPAPGEAALVYTTAVGGDYFRAMGVPLVKGRLFDADRHRHRLARSCWCRAAPRGVLAGPDPLGSRVQFRFTGTAYDAEVVGIVGDVRHEALDRPAPAELFLPYAQSGFTALTLRGPHGAGIAGRLCRR